MSDRLERREGEWIDRSRPLEFTFEGKKYSGFAGDTVTSALWASGRRILGRSFKYHRPRGIFTFANHDVNAVMQDGSLPNVRGDITPVREGHDLKAVNTVGGARWDIGQVNNRLSKFLPVGFYYKAFHKPAGLFPYYEKFIRKAGGLGEVKKDEKRREWGKGYGFCDVLVVGAGPSGLSAAVSAAKSGAKVVIVDENPHPGGALTYSREDRGVLSDLLQKVKSSPNIELRDSTTASAFYEDYWVPLVHSEKGITKMRAKSVVVAGGVMEQPAVFRNNDLPGIMLGTASRRLIHHYAVKPANQGVVLAANDEAYRTALDLLDAGVEISAVLDLRHEGEQSEHGQAVRDAGVSVYNGTCIYEAVTEKRGAQVAEVVAAPLDVQNTPITSRSFRLPCDGVFVSVGWAANAAILAQSGCKLSFSEELQQFVPTELSEGIFAAGRVNGVYATQEKVRDGERAGLSAAKHVGYSPSKEAPEAGKRPEAAQSHPYPVYDHPKGMAFIDFDEDVQLKDIKNSIQEGFDSVALINRYATLGMGPSQGKHSNMNGIRLVARLMNMKVGETGTVTSRPFYQPVEMGFLAGRGFHPERQTPAHVSHEGQGAVLMRAGNWFRPEYYSKPGKDREASILDEVRKVRNEVGLIDVGTLGKLEIVGPGARELVERICTGKFAQLKVGMTRYALMVDEAGIVSDDGVCARLGEDHFYLTATSSGVDSVYAEMKRWLQVWDLDVEVMNHTNAFAAINIAGPRSQEVMNKLTDMDLSEEAFPYLGVREGEVSGIPARLMRVGFVGELGYEIHVPAESGLYLWDKLMETGGECGIAPFGVEAQRQLRLEKGHIIVGQDTDGVSNPWQVNMGWAVKLEKPFFVGQRTLQMIRNKIDAGNVSQEEDRKLVGFAMIGGDSEPRPKECHLIIEDGRIIGRITSIGYSESYGGVIGMAFLSNDKEVGSRFEIKADGGEMVPAEVVSMPFYDPDSERQKVAEKVTSVQGGGG